VCTCKVHVYAWREGRKVQKLQDVMVEMRTRYLWNGLLSEYTKVTGYGKRTLEYRSIELHVEKVTLGCSRRGESAPP
jgi:hypothetical protein